MDLGIAGRKAIVCASSRGLGMGCALVLAREGVDVVVNGRDLATAEATARAIAKETGVKAVAVAADIATAEGRAAVLGACPEPDILVNNAGGPPAGDFRAWGRDDWLKALDANMLAPIEMIKATIDGMIARGFGRIVNITSSTVKAPYPTLGLSNGARAGLTGFVAGLARQVAKSGVTINGLLPGSHATDRLRELAAGEAKATGKSIDDILEANKAFETAGRYGTVEEFGAACAFLCSVHAGFITGQNLVLDGGTYPGTL